MFLNKPKPVICLVDINPVNTKTVAVPIQEMFENLFIGTFSEKKNAKFSKILSKCFNKSQWKNVIKLWREALKMAKRYIIRTRI